MPSYKIIQESLNCWVVIKICGNTVKLSIALQLPLYTLLHTQKHFQMHNKKLYQNGRKGGNVPETIA